MFFFSFSFFQPSLSGSEWLMTLRWIVERSSGGSARPRGGPGPPIAGFVMVCPWCLRCPSYPEIPSFSSLIALCGIRIFKMKLHEPTQHEYIDQDCTWTWNILEWCFFIFLLFTEWSWDIKRWADHSQSAADRLGNVPVCRREQIRGHLFQRRAQDSR